MNIRPDREKGYKKEVQWVAPQIGAEIGEIMRTAEELSLSQDEILKAGQFGELGALSDEDWETMENCCSRDTSWRLEEVRAHLAGDRDFGRIENGFSNGDSIPAPIVLYRDGHAPYLIAGNSRLLACRSLNKRPVVYKIQL